MEKNKIFNEDCIEGLKKIHSESIDAIITDPPYGINKSKIIGDENFWTIGRMLPEAYRVLKKDSFFIQIHYLLHLVFDLSITFYLQYQLIH